VTTEDFITNLFYRVDEALQAVSKHAQAGLHPSEVVTLALLFALKGVGNRAFYRWLSRDYRPLFPQLPERTRPTQVFELYRQRFGIETSYRQMNQVRARTTSRNPTLRLLLVGLAFILVNLYVALRDQLGSASRHAPATASPWLSLRRLALLLGRAVEQLFGVTAILQRRRTLLLS
jgi:IS4 transposase